MTFFEKFPKTGKITLQVNYDNRASQQYTTPWEVNVLCLNSTITSPYFVHWIGLFRATFPVYYDSRSGVTQAQFNAFYPGGSIYGTGMQLLSQYSNHITSITVVSNPNNIPIVTTSLDPLKDKMPYTMLCTTATEHVVNNGNYEASILVSAKEPSKLYHDIYIDGTTDVSNVYIHTHHNIEGRVTSYRYNTIGDPIGGIYNPSGTEGDYERLGNSQYDEGMIQNFTFERLHVLGVDNSRAGDFRAFVLQSVGIKFKDNIVDESNPRGINHFTNYALINKDRTHSIFNNTSGETISNLVVIRFFEGAPPPEVTSTSDSGDDRDDTNYDGTPKDPRTPDDYDDEGELTEGSDEGSAGIFNDIYKVTDANMKSLHNKIWSQDYFNVLKVNSDPIENIISCKRFPFNMEGGADSEITIGNISTGVNGSPISKGIYRVDLGSIYVGEKFKCFLDYYQTNYSIYLPFIGIKPLSATQIVGHTIIVKYIVDVMTGVCKARLFLDSDNFLFAEYDGLMGIDCTLTSSNQKQAELVNATRFINAGVSVATANPMGIASGISGLLTNGVENHYNSTQSNSAIANASVVDCYLIYDEPQVPITNGVYPNNYAKTVGLPCGRSLNISECSGYTKCGGDIQGTFDRATSDEVDEIMTLLQNGIEI